jgi:CubicO group peptidase (beta-lactamase class C family)
MKQAHLLMNQAVSENVFPGGVLMVSVEGTIRFFEAYGRADIYSGRSMTQETVFDLASLTKPLATTPALMVLIQQGKLDLSNSLGEILPGFSGTEKSKITLRHLLCHQSGLPDYRPYYKILKELPLVDRKNALHECLLKEPLVCPTGTQTIYSDLGFMILGWVIEQVSGMRLDRLVRKEIYTPIELEDLFFVDLDPSASNTMNSEVMFAATAQCPWRDLLINGEVHDDNAWVVGGIDGHAGLFGNAEDVNRLLTEIMLTWCGEKAGAVFQKDVVETFLAPAKGSERTLGFDTPSSFGSSSGHYFSNKAVGHLGYTGTSFWMDLTRSIIVILLTNRVHPSCDNEKIKAFRPILHDAVMEDLLN